jgi:peptide/nickel transport system permease protein
MRSWTPGSGTRVPEGAPASAGPAVTAQAPASGSQDGAWPAPAGARRPASRGSALGLAAREVARFVRRKPLGALGGLIVAGMLLMAAFADGLAPYGYEETIRGARFRPPGAAHWLGTDNLGRDLWSRIVYGARVSVTVGFATIALGTLLATAIGVSSGYLGGAYDLAVQRVVDAWMSFPYLVIVLSVMAVLGPGLWNVILSLAVITAAASSRVIRGATIAVARQPHVEAALAAGAGQLRIVLRHVLPNVVPTILILATIGLGGVILAESALSFLGFGVPPPYPSWGGMLSGSGRTHMLRAPWMAIWPGVAISLAVFGFNMLGDALRDVLDPRLRGQ